MADEKTKNEMRDMLKDHFSIRDLRQDMGDLQILECKTCQKGPRPVCEHGHCRICECKEYCWLD